MGFALGLFVGMSPYFFCHSVTALGLAAILKWNKIAAVAGVFITNPFTAPFFYRITWLVGKTVLPWESGFQMPSEFGFQSAMAILRQAPEIMWIQTVGGVIAGLPVSVIGYYLSRWCVLKYRKRNGMNLEPGHSVAGPPVKGKPE